MKDELTYVSHGELCVLELGSAQKIRVASGRVWLTEAGRPVDFVLEAGQTHQVQAAARILIEAQDDAWLDISPVIPSKVGRDETALETATFV